MKYRAIGLSAVIATSGLLGAAAVAHGAVIYNESTSGDAGVNPSSVALGSLAPGNHQLVGGNPDFDTDDYAFTIAAGRQLDAILVDNYTAAGSAALQSPFLGSSVLDASSSGKNFFTLAGITPPVAAGSYLFRTTTGSGGPTTYQYSLQVSAVPAPGTIRYSEMASGDAGVNAAGPNVGALAAGSNRLIGSNAPFDTDDYTFTIAPGYRLHSIVIETYGSGGSAALQTPFLGSAVLSTASVGQDFLDLAGASQPIGPGTYLFRATTGSAGPTTYRFDLQVSAVPEGSSLSLLGVVGAAVVLRTRLKASYRPQA